MASIGSQSAESPRDRPRRAAATEFRVEPFAAHHLPIVAAFSERYWQRPRTREYYDWRYLDSQPFSHVSLAMTDDECLGMVAAFRKTYQIDGARVRCLETFDWHALPGLKGSGVGLRVMRAMMRADERVIAIGGTPDVLKTLPAMGWQNVAAATKYELPLSASALTDGLRRRIPVRLPGETVLLGAVVRWLRPRRRTPLGKVIPVSTIGDEVLGLYREESGYGALQIPDKHFLQWLSAGYAGTGSFDFLYFTIGGRLRGWAATRTYDTTCGREAAILELYAPQPDPDVYAWMVSESVGWLQGGRPRLIRARASCPALQAALLANRFRPGAVIPVHTWPGNLSRDLRWHITLNHTDEPLRPYPELLPD